MFTKSLLVGVTAGILSGVAGIIFTIVYKEVMFVDFAPVVSNINIIGATLFGCILASIGYWLLTKMSSKFGEIIFNMLFVILTFASILGPIMFKFPPELDVKGIDEILMYFQPFAITLHFFPALIWFAVKPLFIRK
jgi:uncharacterized membrane protein